MREKKVIYRFVCDAMLKMAKPKMGVKSSDSNYAHLLDFRVCHQNKTVLLLSIFMFLLLFLVLWVFCCVTKYKMSHHKKLKTQITTNKT